MFVFKFEKMLNIKENMIKKCMLEIANIEAVINKAFEMKEELEQENRQRMRKLNRALRKKPDKDMLLFLSDNIAKTQKEIVRINLEIEKLKKEKAKKIDEATMLNIEKKKLEKLKEKEYENYIIEENRAETRFLDEVANIKSANNIIGG